MRRSSNSSGSPPIRNSCREPVLLARRMPAATPTPPPTPRRQPCPSASGRRILRCSTGSARRPSTVSSCRLGQTRPRFARVARRSAPSSSSRAWWCRAARLAPSSCAWAASRRCLGRRCGRRFARTLTCAWTRSARRSDPARCTASSRCAPCRRSTSAGSHSRASASTTTDRPAMAIPTRGARGSTSTTTPRSRRQSSSTTAGRGPHTTWSPRIARASRASPASSSRATRPSYCACGSARAGTRQVAPSTRASQRSTPSSASARRRWV
mmetsp:Transcript_26347/g.66885  ORF Transcript_26347/g.66885 Transcript_26347/m.66885 type:complete len:268 (+) Transcript_26347:300-1103(+)